MHHLRALRLLPLLLVLLAPAGAQAAPPRARIVTQGQRTLESRATLRVALSARTPGRHLVRLGLREVTASRAVAAGARTVRLRRRGARIVAVPLNRAGRALVGRCRTLEATVTLQRRGRTVARTRRVLSTSGRTCATRAPAAGAPATGAGGSGGSGSPGSAPAGGGPAPGPGPAPGAGSGGSGSGGSDPGPGSGGTAPGPGGGGSTPPEPAGFDTSTADRCDPLDPAVCLQPFPNDHFAAADATSATGKRLALQSASMPRNAAGKPIDPADIDTADGFSPGSSLVTRVPGLDTPAAFRATDPPPIDDPRASLDPASPVLVINTRTGKPHPVWTELDANPAAPGDRNLIIRPAVNFEEGTRYVVALRHPKTAAGASIPPGRAFRVYRDRIITTDPVAEQRRPAMERVLADLSAAGVAREDLFLAWDFTVASAHSATARMLSIRDRAFAGLGDTNLADRVVAGSAPAFTLNPDLPDALPEPTNGVDLPVGVSFSDLDGVRDYTPEQDARIARVVRGTFRVPCYLTTPGCANGGTFAYAPGDPYTPVQIPGNTAVAQFTCLIPRRALDAGSTEHLRPNLYGHGLFGGQGEVFQGQQKSLAQEHGFLPCATNWAGMATEDVPTALAVLQDLSQFPQLIDHVQQGFLQQLFLGRLLLNPQGLASNAAFQRPGGDPVIDPTRLYYDGNSQGGIYGGTLTAIAPDFDRAVLGVPGMNYSTLLPRSVDFDTYAKGEVNGFDAPAGGLYDNYPDELQRPLVLALLQIMWDRGDPNGYAAHMTSDPLPGTPPHEVLMHSSFGDHQVADVTAEVMARTAGARIHRPVLEAGRHRFSFPENTAASPDARPDRHPYDLFTSLGDPGYSATGSGLVFWDIGPVRGSEGEPPPPAANVPPRLGRDPHEAPRNQANGRVQKSAFLRPGGRIVDPCSGPCFAFGYGGGAPQTP